MRPEVLVSTLILASMLGVSEPRAEYMASAVVYAVGDDLPRAAALIATLRNESYARRDVETCRVEGLGGWGSFQLNENTVPKETACGPIDRQALAAANVLFRRKGFDPEAPTRGFARYLGSSPTSTEARHRAAVYEAILSDARCLCCSSY